MLPIEPGGITDRRRSWYVYRAFNLYRIVLGGGLLSIFLLDDQTPLFGAAKPSLFFWTVVLYVTIALSSLLGSHLRRPKLRIQAHFQTLIDLVALTLLIHASGGSSSSISILLVTAVAASSILLPRVSALLMAFLALLLILGEWVYRTWEFLQAPAPAAVAAGAGEAELLDALLLQGDAAVRVGILGASFLIAALLANTMAERARRSEELVRQRTQELLEMAELNHAIVQHLQTGVVVVDRFSRVQFMNDTACKLLNCPSPPQSVPLEEISAPLGQRLANWLSFGLHNPKPFRQEEHLPDITPGFTHLGGRRAFDTLIFLEDSAEVAQRLQQIKLAALGRLTAGIAHEIRNPLASISHAAQLLGESPTVSTNDRRLGQIIHDNAKRASKIIANVMDLSRRDKVRPEDFQLKPWLEEFGREFIRSHDQRTPQIELRVKPENLIIRFDPSQLHQVLWNLCSNACRHGTPPDAMPGFRLAAGFDESRDRPYLEVIDGGPGISEAETKKIFEPFFTTTPQGTGLGLYISREMCEANRAQLQYVRQPAGGSCFRITFANPSKQESKWKPTKHSSWTTSPTSGNSSS